MFFPRSGLAVSLTLLAATLSAAEPAKVRPARSDADGIAFFESRIRPVLVKHCYECHAADSSEIGGNLRVDSREAIRKGGDSGHAVVPGSVRDSLLIDALEYKGLEMPPDQPLPADVIADFRRWIAMGAPDPREDTGREVAWKDARQGPWWSLEPVTPPAPPTPADAAWPRNDIDRFVLAKMEAQGLHPVGDAEPLDFLRRLSFDVIGLPPTPEDIAAYLAASDRKQATVDLVDRWLASPQFGERWGRHWLDVARFAESNGKDRDVLYPEAWRYRQYVIDAFNADKPYDQFIREQIAGDLLPADSIEARNELLIATGFLAIGPKPLSSRGEQLTMDLVDEQIDVTSRAVLGITAACARCHDHKFDPIPQPDYYALAGIFRSTETLYGGGLQTSNSTNRKDQAKATDFLAALSADRTVDENAFEKRLKELTEQAAKAREHHLTVQRRNSDIRKNGETPSPEQIAERQAAQEAADQLAAELEALKKTAPPKREFAMAVRDGKKIEDCKLHIRGEVGKYGDAVPRGFLTAIAPADKYAVAADQSGRLQLAQWLTDPANPLTARVAVNRIWMHLFGRGLSATSDNFGRNGEPPSHPELLDYLASRFMANDWSTKQLVREIVLSRTYGLANVSEPAQEERDPDVMYLWRHPQRRLDVESLRDALLAASGKLELAPPSRSPVAEVGIGEVGRNINTKPLEAEFNHRSVYLPILRSLLPEILRVFDFPEPSLVAGQRDSTTVPAQALYFMNSPYVIQQSEAMADRLLAELLGRQERIERAYLLALSRYPTPKEVDRVTQFLETSAPRITATSDDDSVKRRLAWSAFCQALFASAEFRYTN